MTTPARIDPAAPMIVGVGAVTNREPDGEALELMVAAIEAAVGDAGPRALLDRVGWIGVPEGTWGYADPGRLLAERFGLRDVFTVRADVGRTQQELIGRACVAVRDGQADVALVVGGEAKFRQLLAAKAGTTAPELAQGDGVEPDDLLTAGSLAIDDLEIVRNTVVPTTAYALIENALAAARGATPDEHRRDLADLYTRFAAIAATNPDAWDRSRPSLAVDAENRMMSSPYVKRMCSQWNVDQAAALVVTTAGTADALGVAPDRRIFARASVFANEPVPVPARAELHRAPGVRAAGARAFAVVGAGADDFGVVDLYSCFPSAVQVHAAELGVDLGGQVTRTGGMSFAGGPLNNYVLQAMVRIVSDLRAGTDGDLGLSTSVSGFLTKHGVGVWSSGPPGGAFVHESVAVVNAALPVDAGLGGAATIMSSTVVHERGVPARAVAVVERDGVRSIVESSEGAVVAALLPAPSVGGRVHVRPDGTFALVADVLHM